jgi:hypothetical protein
MTVRGAAAAGFSPEAGDFERVAPFWDEAARKGEAVRLAGVLVREGGLLGRLMVGLSQEEKKSSPGSPAGVLVSDDWSSTMLSRTTSLG